MRRIAKIVRYKPRIVRVYPSFFVKIFIWDTGILNVIENKFDSINDAHSYIDTIKCKNASIKIYNENSELVFSNEIKEDKSEYDLYSDPYSYF